jgi:hypothetical protein
LVATSAEATGAPDESVTTPTILADTCARAEAAPAATRASDHSVFRQYFTPTITYVLTRYVKST